MNITTEHNIGETVFYMHHDMINSGTVKRIRFTTNGQISTINYAIEGPGSQPQNEVEISELRTAKTAEELTKKLLKQYQRWAK